MRALLQQYLSPLHPGLSSSKIFIHRDVFDNNGNHVFQEGYIKVKDFLLFMNLWKPWRPFLPGTLHTDNSVSPLINADGLVLVPIERSDAVIPEEWYDTTAFLQELEATGIPFDTSRPFGHYNDERHPEYIASGVVVASQVTPLPDGSCMFVPLVV